ncbi:GNAT family N-acetyltransferase [Chitinophaga vietnamensis]|uniref:GNAT family N-acetyltransferase n=1 Tax=Chitinophaga vietnamensis TaxID=2593957 RepID=UPI0011775D3C|nr:GNAT family N-acetyltransferase [Chitinophaga vietnamensis]
MIIQSLAPIKGNPVAHWGHNGYRSQQRYDVALEKYADGFLFRLQLRQLENPYIKTWVTTEDDIEGYNEVILEGHSAGIFEDDKLIAMIICGYREWNNSFFVDNLLVAESFRGRGLGRQLMQYVIDRATQLQCRLVELETQNTNVPAIHFYQQMGFNIAGIHTRLYEKDNEHEVALFMTRDV